jgi:hypothetical protein
MYTCMGNRNFFLESSGDYGRMDLYCGTIYKIYMYQEPGEPHLCHVTGCSEAFRNGVIFPLKPRRLFIRE